MTRRDISMSEVREIVWASAVPVRFLWQKEEILQSILFEIGNQCKDSRRGETWLYLEDLKMRRAALFWILWSFAMRVFGSQARRQLQ